MSKLKEAQSILEDFGLPPAQCNDISGYTLLALCGIRKQDSWSAAKRSSLTISKGVMAFIELEYRKRYAPNTRETFRRQVLHQFVQACIADYNPDNPKLPTNSPRAHYAISAAALTAIRKFGTRAWTSACNTFIAQHGSLLAAYRRERVANLVPVRLSGGRALSLSPGKHNELQAAVVAQFAPRFAPGSMLVYLGDTANKSIHSDQRLLAKLGVTISDHDKLPDIVLYDAKRKWLFLVEAVTSHGPMTPKRIVELQQVFAECKPGLIFVSAFPDFTEFRKHMKQIAWDTEVWLSEIPDHLIHYNGDRFLGPR